jgi:hypothetical protein
MKICYNVFYFFYIAGTIMIMLYLLLFGVMGIISYITWQLPLSTPFTVEVFRLISAMSMILTAAYMFLYKRE